MDAAVKHDVEMFVQASTSSIYGQAEPERIPFKEDDAAVTDRWQHIPASKRAAELFAYMVIIIFYDLNITSRCASLTSMDRQGRPDMMPLKALEAILNGDTIQLWDGGHLKRDWTYIDDTVNGVTSALQRPLGYQVVNLGFGDATSLLDFIGIYEELTGKEAVTVVTDAPATEPQITYCDNTLAHDLLDFNPQTPLVDGLKHVWEWYRDAQP